MSKQSDFFSGCMPALMTPCNAAGEIDYDNLAQTGSDLIKSGMTAVIYCGSMGDWPLLTDEQRMKGVQALCEAGVPVVVGTGAQNTARAAALTQQASRAGAAGLMVIPRVLSRGISAVAQEAHFEAILSAAPDLPAVIYNSPYYGFETRAELFFKLRERHQNLVGFKEFGGAQSLSYASEFITSGNPDLSLMIGVDTQVFHGFVNCGAQGAITGVGNAIPLEILRLVELCQRAAKGEALARRYAKELDEALSILSTFDEGPDLVLYYKQLMTLEGHAGYEHHINPSDSLSPAQKGYLTQAWTQFRQWWADWPGAAD
jgi:4-hydroxy-tetrahydrodipicolinate synthase